jgi:predicted TIM-barrel fold metal-dependent hydrolase
MLIDVHIHLSSPYILASRATAFSGEPSIEPIYSDPKARLASSEEVLSSLKEGGVDKALVMGFSFWKEDNARRYNDWLLEECQRRAEILYPLAAFDPRAPFAEKLAESFLDAGGFGLGELCVYEEGLSDPLLDKLENLCSIAKSRGKPILVHVNEPIGHKYPGKSPMEISQIQSLVERSKGAKLILAHFGGGLPFFATLKKEVKETLKNVRFDTAAMPFLYDPKALKIASDVLGPESFLYGSDFPLLPPGRYKKYLSDSGLSKEDSDLIMGENARTYLGM